MSQNAKQRPLRKYSYTLYDSLGRITEVAEKVQPLALTVPILRSERLLRKWIEFRNDLTTYEPKTVTSTLYDEISNMASVYASFTPFRQNQSTLRNRVSLSRYFKTFPQARTVTAGDTTYTKNYGLYHESSIEYSYDIHGNVDSQINTYNRDLLLSYHGDNKYKLITYDYDLISGKVNSVHYNPVRMTNSTIGTDMMRKTD